ncbi:MAG: sugar phosphate isomerase/epimerase [Caldilineaceae bacterium]|nr:sugar phosphate isomerase/epimerase [Caldilineaceae bacterium]
MKLGVSSYTFAWAIGAPGYPPTAPMNTFDLLDLAHELKVGVVQIADNLPLDQLTEADLARLRAQADAQAIQIEVGTRGIGADHLRRYLELARYFGSSILRVVVDTRDDHPSPDEVIARLRPLLPEFATADVILAIENHDRFATDALIHIMRTLNSAHVGICLDTVNSFGALEGPALVVERLGPWTVNLHIKDFAVRRADHNMGFTVEGRPAGRGNLDVPWLLREVGRHGRDFNAILELWPPPAESLDATIAKERAWAEESVDYLRGVINAEA